MSWKQVSMDSFLKSRSERFKPNDIAIKGLKRIDKIDFSGKIYLSDKPSNTDMILVKKGDLVISGINVEKGAMAVYQDNENIIATIHYSSYEYDETKINLRFLKNFLKSTEFIEALKEQVPGGIKTEIKPKHILPLKVFIPTDLKEQVQIVEKLESNNSIIKGQSGEIAHQLNLVKQLRQAFLREAVQGKLTAKWRTENPNVEPASELLKKIKAEKEKLVKEGKLKKDKQLPAIKENEIPFEIPENWEWCRLGEVVEMNRGRFSIRPRNDPRYFNGNYPFLQIGSLDEKGSLIYEAPQSLNEKGLKVSKMFPEGTIAIAIVGGTIGNLGVLAKEMCFTDSMVGIYPFKSWYNQKYILNYLKLKQPEIRYASYQMSGQPNIKIPTLAELYFPLPPLQEQQQIVTKLDELMQYCDDLEKSIKTSQQQNEMLLHQVLREALEPKN
jgi:type I restriction enzyme, S subunit